MLFKHSEDFQFSQDQISLTTPAITRGTAIKIIPPAAF